MTYAELAMIHTGLDAPTTHDGAMTHGEDGENTGIRLGQVACGGASDSGSGHGDLVMGFGFEDEELRGERGKIEEKGAKKKSRRLFFFFLIQGQNCLFRMKLVGF